MCGFAGYTDEFPIISVGSSAPTRTDCTIKRGGGVH